MTESSDAMRTLRLQDPPSNLRFWIFVLVFGLPAVITVLGFGFAFAKTTPTGPLLVAPAVALVACGIALLWILRMLRRITVALDRDALIVDTGITRRRFPLSTLRAGGLRIVSLGEHADLKPVVRTWGIGAPGLASGWFRLRNGGKALCILTGREHVAVLRADDGIWILLALADTAPLRAALGA
jgi:hypothetical protein